jgi:hypothetical protein
MGRLVFKTKLPKEMLTHHLEHIEMKTEIGAIR